MISARLIVVASLTVHGCDSAAPPVPILSWVPLIDHDEWVPTPLVTDPLASHRPFDLRCKRPFSPEHDALEIDTRTCNYASASQPLSRPLEVGDRLAIRMWWYPLASQEPSEAHIALLLGNEIVWEEHVAIPGPADVRELELESPASFGVDDEITIHLHNHGYNNWIFERFDALLEE